MRAQGLGADAAFFPTSGRECKQSVLYTDGTWVHGVQANEMDARPLESKGGISKIKSSVES